MVYDAAEPTAQEPAEPQESAEGDEAGKLGEELGDDVNPEEVEQAIETLNAAIDRVNVLEDEHQSAGVQHAAEQRTLACQAQVVEADTSSALRTAVQATFETGRALQSARRPLELQQAQIRQLQAQAVQLQAELNMSGLWQERMTLSSKLEVTRATMTRATKALNTQRKAVASAQAKDDKARKALQKAHTQLSVGSAAAPAVPLPPLEEELGLLEVRLALSEMLGNAQSTGQAQLAALEHQKEAAAAEVSEAMEALETLSNEIHERRVQEKAAKEAAAAAAAAPPAVAVASEGTAEGGGAARGRQGGDASTREEEDEEEGGQSDFVTDDSEGEEQVRDGMSGPGAGGEPRAHLPPAACSRGAAGAAGTAGTAGTARGSTAGGEDSRSTIMQLTMARLLRQASELVTRHATATAASAASREHASTLSASTLSASSGLLYASLVPSLWPGGVVWADAASMARLRTECSAVATQVM